MVLLTRLRTLLHAAQRVNICVTIDRLHLACDESHTVVLKTGLKYTDSGQPWHRWTLRLKDANAVLHQLDLTAETRQRTAAYRKGHVILPFFLFPFLFSLPVFFKTPAILVNTFSCSPHAALMVFDELAICETHALCGSLRLMTFLRFLQSDIQQPSRPSGVSREVLGTGFDSLLYST